MTIELHSRVLFCSLGIYVGATGSAWLRRISNQATVSMVMSSPQAVTSPATLERRPPQPKDESRIAVKIF